MPMTTNTIPIQEYTFGSAACKKRISPSSVKITSMACVASTAAKDL